MRFHYLASSLLFLVVLSNAVEAGAQTTVYEYSVPANGGYDPGGNLTQYSDTVNGAWRIGYDPLNRVQTAVSQSGPFQTVSLGMQYDSFGNRLSQSVSYTVSPNVYVPQSSVATYDATAGGQPCNPGTNRLCTSNGASAEYDASGNLLSDGSIFARYDAEGRLCALSSSSSGVTLYVYDAEGNRVAKVASSNSSSANLPSCITGPLPGGDSVTSKYLLGQSGETVTELNASDQWVRTQVYAAGALLASYDTNGIHFVMTDPLGTPHVRLNGSGSVDQECINLPFGDGVTCTPTSVDPTQFTGKERDSELGPVNSLNYFGARYYASSMGRFMSPDWDSNPSAVPYADFGNPQSLNLYSYAVNNPLGNADADGHIVCEPDSWNERTNSLTAGACHFELADIANFLGNIAQQAGSVFSNAAQQVASYATAPRDPGCMAGTMAGMAATGAAIGSIGVSAGGMMGGTLVLPGVGTVGGGFAGAAAGAQAGGLVGAATGSVVGFVACASGGGGGSPKSQGNMQQQVEKNQAPKSVRRVDKARTPYEKDHVEFTSGDALNQDGTWKHGGRALTNVEIQWLQKNGWTPPQI